jgi:hypothetical protein
MNTNCRKMKKCRLNSRLLWTPKQRPRPPSWPLASIALKKTYRTAIRSRMIIKSSNLNAIGYRK